VWVWVRHCGRVWWWVWVRCEEWRRERGEGGEVKVERRMHFCYEVELQGALGDAEECNTKQLNHVEKFRPVRRNLSIR